MTRSRSWFGSNEWDRIGCRRNIQIGTDHRRNSESRSQCTVEVIFETIAQITCDHSFSDAENYECCKNNLSHDDA